MVARGAWRTHSCVPRPHSWGRLALGDDMWEKWIDW